MTDETLISLAMAYLAREPFDENRNPSGIDGKVYRCLNEVYRQGRGLQQFEIDGGLYCGLRIEEPCPLYQEGTCLGKELNRQMIGYRSKKWIPDEKKRRR